ncbi:unnamed protein product [Lactuca virosa]|uniref:Small ribosomal subunit protein uS15 N-terminal domain-containing protein n=1 Tax=Lactuca virosa TaxID=75947 RepID=A0AAU9MNT9_9ASTR|nr:unnamed protein product [Lactuca virosa]
MANQMPDIKEAFGKYSNDGFHMSSDQLRLFIEELQGGDGASISMYLIDSRVSVILSNITNSIEYDLTVQDIICKFSKKGLTPSLIGVILHDPMVLLRACSRNPKRIYTT